MSRGYAADDYTAIRSRMNELYKPVGEAEPAPTQATAANPTPCWMGGSEGDGKGYPKCNDDCIVE
jgi:hypothetical protein